MTSVRLRLLILALLPLVVLLPLLLWLAVSRWAANYDNLLIANVESDLRIAEQYLDQILSTTGGDVAALARSTRFQKAMDGPGPRMARFLDTERRGLGLDFLYYLPDAPARDAETWPVIATALKGGSATEIDILSGDQLAGVDPGLAARARLPLIPTEAAVPTDRVVEDRGMVVHTATDLRAAGDSGVLVGGILLNRNLDFIDTINALVYQSDDAADAERQGTATLFLEDVRVSTNVRLFEGERALGTRVSAVVRNRVLDEGRTWLDRAFVVNDWYISGYLPLTDSFSRRVGMLYVGFLEAPFVAQKRSAFILVFSAFVGVLLLTIPLFLRMAGGIFSPLERMNQTMKRVEGGQLDARIGAVSSRDEIGQVAAHLDELLDQVQERDRALRSWADELNTRVEHRTAELREANEKLETTYQQLVMSEKLASIGEITAGVAHEINNPVAVIQGNIDVIRETLGDDATPLMTELNLIDRQIARINAIVGKLLQFARPSEFNAFSEHVDVAAVLDDCLVLVDHVISRRNVTVTTHRAEDAPPVRINPGELQQVIINLVVNAVQAMDGPGELSLSIRAERRDGRSGTAFVVADTGPGIANERLNTVFDPFYTTKPGEGTGLGLSVSQTLIRQSGGLITVRNREAGGAEFTVWLPEDRDES